MIWCATVGLVQSQVRLSSLEDYHSHSEFSRRLSLSLSAQDYHSHSLLSLSLSSVEDYHSLLSPGSLRVWQMSGNISMKSSTGDNACWMLIFKYNLTLVCIFGQNSKGGSISLQATRSIPLLVIYSKKL